MTDNPKHGTPDDQLSYAENIVMSAQMMLEFSGVCSCPACVIRTLVNGIARTAGTLHPQDRNHAMTTVIGGLTKARADLATDDAINTGGNAPTSPTAQ
jgi:hypothetical protein